MRLLIRSELALLKEHLVPGLACACVHSLIFTTKRKTNDFCAIWTLRSRPNDSKDNKDPLGPNEEDCVHIFLPEVSLDQQHYATYGIMQAW